MNYPALSLTLHPFILPKISFFNDFMEMLPLSFRFPELHFIAINFVVIIRLSLVVVVIIIIVSLSFGL